MHLDEERLRRGLAALGDFDVANAGMVAAINEVGATVPVVLGVSGAGMMMIDSDLALHATAWSDDAALAFEKVQEESGEGPCVESLLHDKVVAVEDISADPRWPHVTDAVMALGVRAVMGVPVHLDGENVGALNVYLTEPHEWTDDEINAVAAFATVLRQLLSVAVLGNRNDDLVQQLQSALDTRVVIERAVGLVMGRRTVDAVAAFNVLRAEARSARRRVYEIALEVLDGRRLD
ncbi:MAG TPA: GAF and ANTAR domain-containing protein [Acidimicrobiales bacterium]|nr:GAF and ANTAR domain-containing protein [Acidimicrobiales bacterium]